MTDKNRENRSSRDLFLEPPEGEADPTDRERLTDLRIVVSLACPFSSKQQHAFIDVMAKVLISIRRPFFFFHILSKVQEAISCSDSSEYKSRKRKIVPNVSVNNHQM
jgi:hypothetical protein